MPEGPELNRAALFVNTVCHDKIFSGKVHKSEVSKNPDITWDSASYKIRATSRGKEVKLTLTSMLTSCGQCIQPNYAKDKHLHMHPSPANQTLDIVVRFGMSGKFRFSPVADLHKHAHMNFHTKEGDMVLSFVDQRRFGRWEAECNWGKGRGPCVILEYDKFRENVLKNVKNVAFNKPICEVLLNQKYFNGIGNYLRAEILYRAGIAPFAKAGTVLETLPEQQDLTIKTEKPDLLQLCNTVPTEVINLTSKGSSTGYDPEGDADDYDEFSSWLQCYYNPQMSNMVDHNGRTIWFQGEPGPMAPEEGKTRHTQKKHNTKDVQVGLDSGKKAKLTRSRLSAKVPEKSRKGSTVKEECNLPSKSDPPIKRTRKTKIIDDTIEKSDSIEGQHCKVKVKTEEQETDGASESAHQWVGRRMSNRTRGQVKKYVK